MPRSSTLVAPPAASLPAADIAAGGTPRRRWRAAGALLLAAIVTALVRVPFLHRPLTSDEAGYLLLARHWHPGTSLYGDYWVDRPPLLITLFRVAGDAVGIHLLGLAAAVASVVLVGILGRQLAPYRWTVRAAAVVLAAALLASPLFGFPETDGELLGLPFLLLGLVAFAASMSSSDRPRALTYATLAGAAGMAAVLVKQNLLDVLVYAAVALLASRRIAGRLARAGALAGGAVVALAVTLGLAAVHGTSPAGVWDAVVAFRLRASTAISSESGPRTWERLTRLVDAFIGSGAAALVAVAVLVGLVGLATAYGRRATRPQFAAWAVLVWELCGIALGGSYWLHYLTGLVPGLVLLVLTIPWRRWGVVALGCAAGYAAVASSVAWSALAADPPPPSEDAAVVGYLHAHARPGDGVVVGFGHADIVAESGLTSPYPELWSLPVRVRDPHLTELTAVLTGPRAPRWVVVAGDTLTTWGIDATQAQAALRRGYVERVRYGEWHVWEAR